MGLSSEIQASALGTRGPVLIADRPSFASYETLPPAGLCEVVGSGPPMRTEWSREVGVVAPV